MDLLHLRMRSVLLVAPLLLAGVMLTIAGLVPTSAAAQGAATGTISGVVSGAGGQPVVGVRVTVQGTTIGAITNDQGRFTITGVAAGNQTLRAQRIGYAPRAQSVVVTPGGSATADFQLEATATTLTQQVVVGYTTQQRRDVSDAVASVTGAELRNQQVATLEEALRGRIPGVNVVASGEPGRPAQVIIRGQNFVSGNTSPLYVVDGMYMSQNPNMNPDAIESIEVLKDASAAAQYGAQAANGVVVIRTRRGRAGETRTDLRSYYGFQEIPKRIDMMNAQEWAAITQEAYKNGNEPVPAGALNPTVSTDWQDALFRSGAIQDHNLSFSGGSPTADYLVGGEYLEQKGAIISTGFKRYSVRVNSEARRGRFTFGENISLSRSDRHNLNGFPLIDAVRMLPGIPVYDPANPGGFGYGSNANPTFGTNPVGQQLARENTDRSNQVIGSGYAEFKILPYLRYRFNGGVNYASNRNRNFRSISQLRFRDPPPYATLGVDNTNFTSLLFENLLMFDKDYGALKHRINAVAGFTAQRQDNDALFVYRQGFVDEDLTQINAGSTAGLDNRGSLVQSRLNAMLLRGSYSLLNRYLVTASIRRDGSSRFGPGNRYGTFGAASVGWVVSEEGFYNSIPLLGSAAQYLKFRASTGTLGNQDIGDYQYSAPINQNVNYMFGNGIVSGSTQLSLANPNIKWQSNKETNVGMDLGLLDDRLTFSADYYTSKSDGLLVSAPIPWSLGASGSPVVNAGSVRNKGFELNLAHHMVRSAFSLNTTLNLTTINNKVISLGNGGQPIFAGPFGVARTAVGFPIGEFYVFKTAGIFQSAAEVAAHKVQPNAVPGDVRFVDLNGDGVLNDQDRYNAGSGIPKWTGGLFFSGKASAFDYALNFTGSRGAEIFSVVKFWSDRTDDPQNHRKGYVPWSAANTNSGNPRAVWGPAGTSNDRANSDRWIEDGSFIRVQNLVLGYSIPSSVFQRAGIRGASPRIYLNVQNLHTFTDYSGWDPEVLGFADPLARGIDDGRIFPNVRTVSFGLDLRF
ncbi:MAG TPA: SusC/RagA family TonB-linked outer membrane protein [Gemmatimonadaceae bacterium]|nr:SusC/RagA family TonB-linked outer membrane protein [Gemmatimonadaceae bacterium]